jgi:predicted membrane-bound mannosyltransferase
MNLESTATVTCAVSPPIRWMVFVVLALLALALRLPQLGTRPMHTDESINAFITGELLAGQEYHYDPQDRHGPLLYAVAEPLARLLGARNFSELTEAQLRLTPVIIGSATILLFGAGVEMFGFIPCLVAALLFAFAPLPVYYNRYFIHETLFVAATLGLILAGWRAGVGSQSGGEERPDGSKAEAYGSLGAGREPASRFAIPSGRLPGGTGRWPVLPAALAGFCAALMLACKETAVIHFFALGVAGFCAWLLPPRAKFPAPKVVAVALIAFLFVAVLLFTWFGRHWSVFTDLLHAVPRFAARAGGEGHEKPFGYYFHLLDPMLVLFLVAAAGAYAAIWDAAHRLRKPPLLMLIYGLVIFLIYSLIPYKTPWLALNLWLPLALACGLGVAAFCEQLRTATGRWVLGLAGAFLLAVLGSQTKVLVFDRPSDEKNPYAYSHTGDDILGLAPRLEELAGGKNLLQPRIAVIAADAWPLPWYLRKFSHVGYWQPSQESETGPADFWITSTDLSDSLKERLKDFRPEFFGVRPGVLILLWIPPAQKTKP